MRSAYERELKKLYEDERINAEGLPEDTMRRDARKRFAEEIGKAFRNRGGEDSENEDEDSEDEGNEPQQDTGLIRYSLVLLDYLEDLAVGLDAGVYDDKVARDLLKGAVLHIWDDFNIFVTDYRTQQKQDDAYKSVEDLCGDWRRKSDD